jgi:hypothetical protein
LSTDSANLGLQEVLDTLQKQRHERKDVVLDRARAALAAAREDIARGIDVDQAVIDELQRSISEFERYTVERPGLPPE